MHYFKTVFGSLFATAILSGCIDQPSCESNNPIFQKYAPETREYQSELIHQIERIGSDNLSYWVGGYKKEGEREYIYVDVQGGGLCAKARVSVTQWRNIEGLRRETSGYRGAKLVGFEYTIQKDTLGDYLVYNNVKHIID